MVTVTQTTFKEHDAYNKYWIASVRMVDREYEIELLPTQIGEAQTTAKLKIKISVKDPYGRTPLGSPYNQKIVFSELGCGFASSYPCIDETIYYNPVGEWTFYCPYDVTIYENGVVIASQSVLINWAENPRVFIDTPKGRIYITNLGALWGGLIPIPPTSLTVWKNPQAVTFNFYLRDSFISWFKMWQGEVSYGWLVHGCIPLGVWPGEVRLDFNSLQSYMENGVCTGQKVDRPATYGKLNVSAHELIYKSPFGSFVGSVDIEIPETLAKTIAVVRPEGNPVIERATPSVTRVVQGDTFYLDVVVHNTGSHDTISVSPSQPYFDFYPQTTTRIALGTSERFTFKWKVYARTAVNQKILITAQSSIRSVTIETALITVVPTPTPAPPPPVEPTPAPPPPIVPPPPQEIKEWWDEEYFGLPFWGWVAITTGGVVLIALGKRAEVI